MTEVSKGQQAAEATLQGVTALGVAVASVTAGPAGFVGAVIAKEAVDAAGKRLVTAVVARRDERAARILSIAASQFDAGIDRFCDTVEDSPELLALLSATVQEAMNTPLEAKIRALGGCLARGVRDDTRVDAEMLRVRGLAGIENPEATLMALLNEAFADPESGASSGVPPLGWSKVGILEQLPGFDRVLDASIARLVAEGLAVDVGIGVFGGGGPGREQWVLTAFGVDCLNLLQGVGQYPED